MFYVGVDLGQRQDYTALAVVEREEQRHAWQDPVFLNLRVRHLERIPLGTSFVNVVQRLGELLRHPKMAGVKKLAVDATGVGAAVVEMIRASGLPCPVTAVTITSGAKAQGQGENWCVPKKDLLHGLTVLLEQGQLRISRRLPDTAALMKELTSISVKVRETGTVRMGADASGEHDDLVFAVALGCWSAGWSSNRPLNKFGTQRLL